MKRLLMVGVIICASLSAGGYAYREFVARRSVAEDRPYELWIASLKGFQGVVRYVGDRDGYSYFRTGNDYTCRYKRPTSDPNLPKTFPVGEEDPYRVTYEMVPQYKPDSSKSADTTIENAKEAGEQSVQVSRRASFVTVVSRSRRPVIRNIRP